MVTLLHCADACPTGLYWLMRDGENLQRGVPVRGQSSASTRESISKYVHTQTRDAQASLWYHAWYPAQAPPWWSVAGSMLNGLCGGRDLKLSWCSVCSRLPHFRALMDCSHGKFRDFVVVVWLWLSTAWITGFCVKIGFSFFVLNVNVL